MEKESREQAVENSKEIRGVYNDRLEHYWNKLMKPIYIHDPFAGRLTI